MLIMASSYDRMQRFKKAEERVLDLSFPIRTIYYIVNKVFNYKKNIKKTRLVLRKFVRDCMVCFVFEF